MNKKTSSTARLLPLTDIIYAILGLTFLNHKVERIARDLVYVGVKALVERHPEYFSNIYFTERGSLMHSKAVEDALFRLGGVLDYTDFPRCQNIVFDESELSHVEKKLRKWFSPPTQVIVKELADEFYKKIKG